MLSLDGFRRVELREVLSDDLVGPIALDAFSTGIPGQDVAIDVEHEDRVVLHPLHEQLKTLFAFSQRPAASGLRQNQVRSWETPSIAECGGRYYRRNADFGTAWASPPG